MQTQKVYILDYDTISPLGIGKEAIMESLRSDLCAEKSITRFDTTGIPCKTAAEVPGKLSGFSDGLDPKVVQACFYDRKLELTVILYQYAKTNLHAIFNRINPIDKGITFGVGLHIASLMSLKESLVKMKDKPVNLYFEAVNDLILEKSLLSPVMNPCDIYPIYLASELELFSFQKPVLTACAASTQAIALAYDAIKFCAAKAVLAGGVDSIMNDIAFGSFNKLGVLAESDEPNARALCRPFDINRCGTLAGEAAGYCVMAGEDFVKETGLEPKFELLGYGNTLDAYKITAPDPSGNAMARAIQAALDSAGIHPEEVDYINLHGTGTRANDEVELDAFKRVFIGAMKNIPISSTKDRHGHAIAAAGIQEFNNLCLCMENDFIPQTVNLSQPIVGDDFDLVMHENRKKKIRIGITNNFAFGGVNTVLIVKNLQ